MNPTKFATEAQRHRGLVRVVKVLFQNSVSLCLCGKFFRIALVLLAVLGIVAAQSEQKPLPGPVQPIAFSHKLHAGAQNLKCATCHKNPEPGERMGLATPALCMQCHEEVKTDSPEIQKLATYAKDKREINWRRVYEIPSYVFFSHRTHLSSGVAGLTCVTCHGEVKELEQMYKVKEINMASCMNCHQANKASTDCTYCHDKMN
jgi:hypothetical protein